MKYGNAAIRAVILVLRNIIMGIPEFKGNTANRMSLNLSKKDQK